MSNKTITLGAGCFWCLETAMRRIRGVQSAVSGYTGGQNSNPTYQAVRYMSDH